MVIWPAFRMGQYRVNDHPYHAPQFTSFILYISTPTRRYSSSPTLFDGQYLDKMLLRTGAKNLAPTSPQQRPMNESFTLKPKRLMLLANGNQNEYDLIVDIHYIRFWYAHDLVLEDLLNVSLILISRMRSSCKKSKRTFSFEFEKDQKDKMRWNQM